jgi:2,5-dioxopentanoate dehydrogenase
MSSYSKIDDVMKKAEEAFHKYKKFNGVEKGNFLRTIASQLEALGDLFIKTANEETHLPEARLRGERARTIHQLNAFATLLEKGDWVNASIDVGDTERKPLAKPDLRKMLFPLGPVVVFGASNFPFAFSTAGGDTASALASGCSVVVKSHPAHPRTSALAAKAIGKAIEITDVPEFTFQHIEDSSIEAGQQLVQHSLTKSASFTGSYQGGKALFDLASQRSEPIPFFAEMGSINPVVLLPGAIKYNKELASMLAGSITLGAGQFCTNPGLMLAIEDIDFYPFLDDLSNKISTVSPSPMLHRGIAATYDKRKNESLQQPGVKVLAEVATLKEETGSPALGLVSALNFLENDYLKEEVFGPYSLVVKCRNEEELTAVIKSLKGQLTATLFGDANELQKYPTVIDVLRERCGRLIFNGVPTGVEVCKSMQHGGPFPSTSDSRFTSVGVDAIYRFVRPVAYQDFPESQLPMELRNSNKLNILRCVNGEWTRNQI